MKTDVNELASVLDCSPCVDYHVRRHGAIDPHITDENIDRFIVGVHQRHLEGLSLSVCARCGCSPDKPCGTRDEMLEPDLCSACVAKKVRERVLYSVSEGS